MLNVNVFDKIFWEIGAKHNLTTWYEIFNSEVFDEVETEICKYFNVTSVDEIDNFDIWYNEMYKKL